MICPLPSGGPGKHMNAAVTTIVVSRSKRAQVALLAVLFTIAYGLLLMMVVRQGKTIQSQRSLIHLLFKDNQHLKAKTASAQESAHSAYADDSSNQVQAQVPSSQVPSIQVPSTQIPLIQVPPLQAAPDKEKPQAGTKTDRKSRKAEKALPARPPAELTDPSDMRRVSFAI
jgi:hypothetical protein